mmetsp:Transcript_27095/g.42078  ORF Transcript_27095/g.42078 Transcript_27095/m.42078 type:complete len:91 (-) Transcript_27095:141-413(-)
MSLQLEESCITQQHPRKWSRRDGVTNLVLKFCRSISAMFLDSYSLLVKDGLAPLKAMTMKSGIMTVDDLTQLVQIVQNEGVALVALDAFG